MAFIVHVIGWRGPLPTSAEWRCLHLPPGEIHRAGPLLLLGEGALEAVEPSEVRSWLAGGRRRAILHSGTRPVTGLEDWLAGGAIELVGAEALGRVLALRARQLELGLAAWPLELADWWPSWAPRPRAGGFVERALSCLPTVYPLHDVSAWARASGAASHWQLRRRLAEALGMTPRQCLQLHLLAQVRAADVGGLSLRDQAVIFGYADESSLGHARRRAARRFEGARVIGPDEPTSRRADEPTSRRAARRA